MELAEVLQGWLGRKWPGNTSCDAFLHFNSLIRAQPKKLVHFLKHHFIFFPRDPWFQRERGGDHTAWVGAALDNGVYKWIFAFCYCIFHLQVALTSLFTNTTWFGVHCASRLCSSEAASSFSVTSFCCIITFWWKFLSRIAKSAFSFSQCSTMFPTSALGPSLPLKHILKPLTDGVNGDVSCTKLLLVSVEPEKIKVKVSTRCSRNTVWINLGKLVTTNDLIVFVALQQPLKHRARHLFQHESWKPDLSSPHLDPWSHFQPLPFPQLWSTLHPRTALLARQMSPWHLHTLSPVTDPGKVGVWCRRENIPFTWHTYVLKWNRLTQGKTLALISVTLWSLRIIIQY